MDGAAVPIYVLLLTSFTSVLSVHLLSSSFDPSSIFPHFPPVFFLSIFYHLFLVVPIPSGRLLHIRRGASLLENTFLLFKPRQ